MELERCLAPITFALLAPLAHASDGEVEGVVKISATSGGLAQPPAAGDWFGCDVALLGDLDGDGIGELAVGARFDDQAGPNRGAVHVLFMNADGSVRASRKITEGSAGFTGALLDHAIFGTALARVDDLDGDHLPELAVGAPGNTTVHPPFVFILFLAANGTVKSHVRIGAGQGGLGVPVTLGGFGRSIACIGDIDGTHLPELAVGGAGNSTIAVCRLNADGTVSNSWQVGQQHGGWQGPAPATYGGSMARIDDLDGDGIAEIAMGCPGNLSPFNGPVGTAWLLYPNPIGTVHDNHELVAPTGFEDGLDMGDLFGESIVAVGDLDGNGVRDLAVGATRDDDGGHGPESDRGAVWILFLEPDGSFAAHQKISAMSGGLGVALDAGDQFGGGLASLGDFFGDGVNDLAVGAPLDDDGGTDAGAVYLLDLAGFAHPPAASVYNGKHGNELRLASIALPRLGATWKAELDTSGHPGVFASLVVFRLAPLAPGVLGPTGELLVNLAPPFKVATLAKLASGGTVVYTATLPDDPSLLGLALYAQGLLVGGGDELTNALEIVIGN